MTSSRVRARWTDGQAARLAWATMPEPQLLDTAAASGNFDAIVLDVQHGSFDERSVLDAVRTLGRWPVDVLARIPSADPDRIGWLLDAGVQGLIVAMCDSATEAEQIVRSVRYAPDGARSYGVFRVANGDPFANAADVVVLPMIESGAGLADVEAIIAVDGVDGVFIGPSDLGLALGQGVGQDRTEAPMVAAFATIRGTAHAAGKRCGIFAVSTAYAAQCAADGYDLVVPWVDGPATTASVAAARLP